MASSNARFPSGASYLVTRLYPRGQVFHLPAAQVNQVLRACIGDAAERAGVQVLSLKPLSRYCQIVATDHRGRFGEFLEQLGEHVRCLDRSPDRSPEFWARGTYCVVRIPGTGPRR